MDSTEMAYCACGAKVPLDLMAAHLTEHDLQLTAQEIADAEVLVVPSYRIIRFRRDQPREVLETGVTLKRAREHCGRDDSHGENWFDGYEREEDE